MTKLGHFWAVLAGFALLGTAGCGTDGGADRAPRGAEAPARAPALAPALAERVLFVGWDGGSWNVAEPLLREGRLPHLARLIDAGVRCDLQTLEPTVSPAIWTTIATGRLPEDHGILGFEGVPGRTMTTLPNAGMRRVKAFWEILRDAGASSGTIGWWATWPADSLGEGSYLITDRVPYTRMEAAIRRAGLDPDDAYPSSLLDAVASLVERPDDIAAEAAERFLGFDEEMRQAYLVGREYQMGSFLPEFKFVYQSDRSTYKMALRQLRESPADVTTVYFTGIDTVSHLFWHFSYPDEFPEQSVRPSDVERFGGVIAAYYEEMDRYLGGLLDAAGSGTTVIIASDHGFGGTGNLPWSGGHGRITPGAPIAPDGLFVMSGPGVRAMPERARVHVLDIAPTLLALLGVPAGGDMPGRVLEELLDGGPAPGRISTWETVGVPHRTGEPVDPAGDAGRIERLRALGYIQ